MLSRLDVDFVDFLECSSDLPRATSTSAISSASVFKMITRVGETVNKMAYKMEEGDPWFEEKTLQVEQMESQLKKLHCCLPLPFGPESITLVPSVAKSLLGVWWSSHH